MPPYPRKLINEGETVVLDLKPHWFFFWKHIVAGAVILVVFLIWAGAGTPGGSVSGWVLTIALLVVRFPFAQALIPRYQVDAVWWSFTVSSALAATLAVLYYRYGDWRHAHMAPPAPA